jgi:hypothetical protein
MTPTRARARVRMRAVAALVALVGPALAGGCAVANLQVGRYRWHTTRPAAYELTIEAHCYCALIEMGPVVVTVRDGRIEGRRSAATGAPVDTGVAALFPDVDGLFALIGDALRRGAADVDVRYDRRRGYPVHVRIDYVAEMADEEIAYVVRGYRPL